MKNVHWLIMIGALAACHKGPHGVRASQDVDVSQAPSAHPTNQPPFQIQGGGVTITPDADYSASGVFGVSSTRAFGEFSLVWGPGVEKLDPTKVTASDLASGGQLIVINVSDDANIVNAIKGLEKGQHVRVSGWRSTMERGGKTLGPVIKESNADVVVVFPTELQIDDTVYAPSSVPGS